jgi:hypothetical protein
MQVTGGLDCMASFPLLPVVAGWLSRLPLCYHQTSTRLSLPGMTEYLPSITILQEWNRDRNLPWAEE